MENIRNMSNDELLRLSNEESKKITRESIVTALILLFAEKPYEKITVTEIVKKAGVSRTAFYRNYQTKDDVVKELSQNVIDELNRFFYGEKYRGNGKLLLLDIFNLIKKNDKTASVIFKSKQMVYEILGGKTYLDSVMPNEISTDYYDMISTETALKKVIIEWYNRGMKESPEEMAEYCHQLAFRIINKRIF